MSFGNFGLSVDKNEKELNISITIDEKYTSDWIFEELCNGNRYYISLIDDFGKQLVESYLVHYGYDFEVWKMSL